MQECYIGLISGTSADGIDAVIADFSQPTPRLIAKTTYPIPAEIQQEIYQLSQPANELGKHRIDRLGKLDHQLGLLFAEATHAILQASQLAPDTIRAIGSHGQTIRHRPDNQHAFTLQIGDANVIAFETNILTVADFRRMDMAAGGQGAPLAPAFHAEQFKHSEKDRVILNLGGIANITWLPSHSGDVIGFDTGPASALMDLWIQKHQQKPYDAEGAWAATGQLNEDLLDTLLTDNYFKQAYPKSTGREYFDEHWLQQKLTSFALSPQDIQRTLLELTAVSVADQIVLFTQKDADVLVCGGGRLNQFLMKRLQQRLGASINVMSTDTLGVDGDFVEAMTFAWLAKKRLNNETGNVPSVTGAKRSVVLGSVFTS
ncbi:anhydro-N-acetylmuramic acid kinase [Pleionea sp. CnH1-48]|uniref:anhydro-N-acetylmuramic acid kinase n=1 Tax=Pleionea sp. CnH1-48 TaxID=2954494 RepID=UPI002097A6DB|nr:anhydro-N-acetylmuramic acid kinase [Pleionea sp. CnH1-48]MCO7227308.1 anhydro-N-acetylmuramic acid kinase [Pleionea sp. CnH1-48]